MKYLIGLLINVFVPLFMISSPAMAAASQKVTCSGQMENIIGGNKSGPHSFDVTITAENTLILEEAGMAPLTLKFEKQLAQAKRFYTVISDEFGTTAIAAEITNDLKSLEYSEEGSNDTFGTVSVVKFSGVCK